MKKTLLAVVMFSGLLSAQAGVAISDNIYGIINIPIVAGMNAVGINLLPIDSNADRIHDVVLPDGLIAGEQGEADGLWIYDGTYSKYYLASGNVWTNGSASPATTLGQGVWISTTNSATIYQVGLLNTNATADITAASTGHSFIANPFAAALNVDDGSINWGTATAEGKNALTGDLLRIWTGSKYDTYYYYDNGTSGGWYSYDNKGRRPPLILAGEGFFFQRKTDNTTALTVNNPLD